ncbi:MAG: hypothetical protein NBV63_00975 [Candidatus Pacebacteria bacterium]|nr:hypothetical protein [Candidatus Paceibacterota bacterium]
MNKALIIGLAVAAFFITTPAYANTVATTTPLVSVSVDSSNTAFKLVVPGVETQTLPIRFTATVEQVTLQRVTLKVVSGSYSDVRIVRLYNGSQLVGQGLFVGSDTTTLTISPVVIPRNTFVVLSARITPELIGVAQPIQESGRVVKIAYASAEGVGVSGARAVFSGAATSDGVRIMKSTPTVSLISLPVFGAADNRMLRFSIRAAPEGPVTLGSFAVQFVTTGVSVRAVDAYAYTDAAFSIPASPSPHLGGITLGTSTAGVLTFSGRPIYIPAGQTRYFEVRGSYIAPTPYASITSKLLGSANLAPAQTLFFQAPEAFMWSPNSLSQATTSTRDWFNGHAVVGLPSSGQTQGRVFDAVQPRPTCELSSVSMISASHNAAPARISWTSSNATSLVVDRGVGAVTPVSSGSMIVQVSTRTVFTGTATGPGGTTTCTVVVEPLFANLVPINPIEIYPENQEAF